MISEHDTQDGSKDEVDKVQRVRIEPERTGWARLFDFYQKYDQGRVQYVKEDIDTLLVFVGIRVISFTLTLYITLDAPYLGLLFLLF